MQHCRSLLSIRMDSPDRRRGRTGSRSGDQQPPTESPPTSRWRLSSLSYILLMLLNQCVLSQQNLDTGLTVEKLLEYNKLVGGQKNLTAQLTRLTPSVGVLLW